MTLTIRSMQPNDLPEVSRILYESFRGIAARHGFEPSWKDLASTEKIVRTMFHRQGEICLTAESGGRIAGSVFIYHQDPVAAIGPISVDPSFQSRGAGRRLMTEALDRTRGAASVRLTQDAFNTTSLSLYASLGFEVREFIVTVSGRPEGPLPDGVEVGPLEHNHLGECLRLMEKIHGVSRIHELSENIGGPTTLVALRQGRVTACSSLVHKYGFGLGETLEDLIAVLQSAADIRAPKPVIFLIPARDSGLFHWCLARGMRAVRPCTLMTRGFYQKPAGRYFISELY